MPPGQPAGIVPIERESIAKPEARVTRDDKLRDDEEHIN